MQHECTCGGGRGTHWVVGAGQGKGGQRRERAFIYSSDERLSRARYVSRALPATGNTGPVLAAEPRAVTWSPGVHRIMKLLCPCAIQPLPRSARGLAPASALAPGPLPPICLANVLLFFGVQLYSRSPRKPSLPSLLSQLPPLLASPYLSICLFCLSLKT